MNKTKNPRTVFPLGIEYSDLNGELTERVVDIYPELSGNTHVCGFCRLRNGYRIFTTNRILRSWDADSGEPVLDIEAWLAHRWEISPKIQATKIIQHHQDGLTILLYMAHADNAFRAREKELFNLFLQRVAGAEIKTHDVASWVLQLAHNLPTPETETFHRAIDALRSAPRDYRMAVCATAKAMIMADKKTMDYESTIIDYLIHKLKPKAE